MTPIGTQCPMAEKSAGKATSVTMMKHCDKGSLEEKEFILASGSRWIDTAYRESYQQGSGMVARAGN